MGALAERAGVSRQTVYNEWGSRERVAEAMVLRELGAFLAEVDAGFDAHPQRLRPAVAEAIARVLALASVNPLLRAIVTATHGAETELVPLLTTRADTVIAAAQERVRDRLSDYPGVSSAALLPTADLLVRTVLSHVMQPSHETPTLAENLSEVADLLLMQRLSPSGGDAMSAGSARSTGC